MAWTKTGIGFDGAHLLAEAARRELEHPGAALGYAWIMVRRVT